jgi:tetratricopeptide (TPR) repeat protein
MKRCFIIIYTVAILGCSDSKETRMQRFLIQGNEKIREREYEQAEKCFLSALKLDSCFADALNNLGTVEQRRKNLPGAIKFYSRAIRCDDKFLMAYINRANALYEANRPEDALLDLAWIEQTDPDTAIVHELKGLVFWKLRQSDKALSSFRKLLHADSLDKNALINIGTIYTSLKEFDSADYYLRKALSVEKDNPLVSNAMAMLFTAKGDHGQGMKWIEKALQSDATDPYFLNNKAYILLMSNQNDKAIQLIDESIASDPYNGWAYRNKGIYFYKTGRYDDALRLLNRARGMDPAIEDLDYWLGMSYDKSGDRLKACEHLMKAVEQNQIQLSQLPSSCR